MTRPRRTLTSALTAALALLPAAGVAPSQAAGGPRAFERELRRCTADERARAGLPALHASKALNRTARSHARSMARRGFFSHTDRSGRGAAQRVRARAATFRRVGENLAAGQRTPRAVCRAWMASAAHRRIVLSPGVTAIGTGTATGGHYGRYAVLIVGTTRR